VTHLTARQRKARRSPLDAAQIAPVHAVAPVMCARESCRDPRLIHRDGGPCLTVGCSCESYVEEP
jgi:hypothetical protein